MGLIQDNKAWYITKRLPKLECKTEIRIGCFKYRGRDTVFCDGNKISSNICHWPELWQALNISTSQCDIMVLRLNIHTARFMMNWVFPLTDYEDGGANQLKSPVQAPGAVGLQSLCTLRHTHTHIHKSMRLLIWVIWQKYLHLLQHPNWERRLANKTLNVKMAERMN